MLLRLRGGPRQSFGRGTSDVGVVPRQTLCGLTAWTKRRKKKTHRKFGGRSIEPSHPPPPPIAKKDSVDGTLQETPKTNPGTPVVPMGVVFVFKDTRPPVHSGYMYEVPQHGFPLEPCEL